MIARFPIFGRRFSEAWRLVTRLARCGRPTRDGYSPGPMTVTVVAASHVGKVRPHNEDSFLIESLGSAPGHVSRPASQHCMPATGALLLVADGMGGPAAGEVASAMATAVVSARLTEVWRHHDRPTRERVSQCLSEAMAAANGEIHSYASRDPQLTGMGTTATVVVLLEDQLCVGHVGDSRAYLVRAGRAQQLTADHSWIQHLLDTGTLSPEEAARSPQRHILLRALGPQPEVAVDVSEHPLRDGDVLVLCSDGLWSTVAEDEIVAVLSSEPNLGVVCDTLIDLANMRGGLDNITVLAARVGAGGRDSTTEDADRRSSE